MELDRQECAGGRGCERGGGGGGEGEGGAGSVLVELKGLGLGLGKGGSGGSVVGGKGKTVVGSDEEEPSFTEDGGEGGSNDGKSKKTSPWQRMKWTDSMVKLLIGVVLYVGEDGSVDGGDGGNHSKRKQGILQKKGKWKSVSRVMMEKGCYVSPQQCEDKFNDLNKRYKRLNDILGKNGASNVIDNPGLVDSMGNLAPKAKEDVKKILSSKHLFYKEMAFYHCGNKAALSADLEFQPSLKAVTLQSREMIERIWHGMKNDVDSYDDKEEEEEEDEEDEEEDVDDENDIADGVEEEGDAIAELHDPYGKRRKLSKKLEGVELGLAASNMHEYGKDSCNGVEIVNNELMGVLQESPKAAREHQLWLQSRTMQLEEQKVGLQAEAFNLEKQRFKWQKFSCKKDREIEKLKLENERMKLENERMALQLRQREMEMDSRKSEASMQSIALILERLQSREHMADIGRGQCVQ